MTTTIILPVSRANYLSPVFHSLEMLECDVKQTSLLVMVDGDDSLHALAKQYVDASKFACRQCLQFREPGFRNLDIKLRRERIARIHTTIQESLPECQYVLSVEDDGVFGPQMLTQLQKTYSAHPHAGFVSGVELGRWSVNYVGAWLADDVYEPTSITSIMPDPKKRVVEVDAAGLYAMLIRREAYAHHKFEEFDATAYGPDIALGIKLRQSGYRCYADWSVQVEHRTMDRVITLANTEIQQARLSKKGGLWSNEILTGDLRKDLYNPSH